MSTGNPRSLSRESNAAFSSRDITTNGWIFSTYKVDSSVAFFDVHCVMMLMAFTGVSVPDLVAVNEDNSSSRAAMFDGSMLALQLSPEHHYRAACGAAVAGDGGPASWISRLDA